MTRRQKRKRARKIKRLLVLAGVVVIILYSYIVITLVSIIMHNLEENYNDTTKVEETLEENTQDNGNITTSTELNRTDYPDALWHAYEINPEMEEFVRNYPLKKGIYSKGNLNDYLGQAEVPLLLQWDSRWGYYSYGSSVMGVTGCGPTCLSMVALHLLQDASLTPIYMAEYALENGYYADGIGTAWNFMADGARSIGLNVQEVSLTERIVKRHLENGRPIICAMGKGDFTETGHFIVLIGVEDGKIRVNDPNSRVRSEKLWDFEEFQYQIKAMWAYSAR